ncbi:MAG: glycosyltransferase [Phycisphaerae bacterium]|nr:glycosyltransferase [Phycisphaerae bacterium]
MSLLEWSLALGLAFALQATALALVNLRRYRRADLTPRLAPTSISVCIPARNEESNVEACVASLLASGQGTTGDGLAIEVLCYDDQSTDRTPEILARLVASDARVRVVRTVPLPARWNGKQHACWRLAQEARGEWLLFTDADVRFAPDALRRSVGTAQAMNVALLSTVPHQLVGSIGEALLVPMIHVFLLSYLPIRRMRSTLEPAASAGCGQFLLARADAYRATGGHAAFPESMHDGIRMPRHFRTGGFRTDLFDGTDLVACRMYRGLRSSWHGFTKNAFEGLGNVGLLVLLTVLHLTGHVWPWCVLAWWALSQALGWPALGSLAGGMAAAAVAVAILGRVALARRFRQPIWIALAHPVAVLLMTAVQWQSLLLSLRGRRQWKGRIAEGDTAGAAT